MLANCRTRVACPDPNKWPDAGNLPRQSCQNDKSNQGPKRPIIHVNQKKNTIQSVTNNVNRLAVFAKSERAYEKRGQLMDVDRLSPRGDDPVSSNPDKSPLLINRSAQKPDAGQFMLRSGDSSDGRPV